MGVSLREFMDALGRKFEVRDTLVRPELVELSTADGLGYPSHVAFSFVG